jgi:hypothetical protein
LKGLEGKEKCFTLHNFCTNSGKDEDRYISLSSSTSSSSSSSQQRQLQRPTPSKVYPEIKFYSKNNNNTCHQVKTRLDCNTESILKRLDAVLLAHKQNNPTQRAAPKPPSSMSVCRNESGIDVHLPHGLLRSTLISKTQTQYSLMTGPNSMVFQIVLPEINGHSQSTSNIQVNKKPISGEEMAALVEYGSQYLNTFESANKPQPILANTTLDRGESNLSSLDDLEKV